MKSPLNAEAPRFTCGKDRRANQEQTRRTTKKESPPIRRTALSVTLPLRCANANKRRTKRETRREVRCNKMGSCCFVDEINKRDVTTASAGGPGADEVLVAAAKDGDEQAFGVLIERHHRKILALALRYVRVREDAEDIVQQTFQKAFVNLHRFEGKSSFCTWLTRIAINEALMLLRRGHALRQVALDDSSEDESATRGLQIPDSGPGPEMSYLQREGAQVLCAAIDELNPRMRTAIELRELAQLSTQETARRMGLSAAGVKARAFHGRRKLRKILWRLEITPKRLRRSAVARLANRTCVNSGSQLR